MTAPTQHRASVPVFREDQSGLCTSHPGLESEDFFVLQHFPAYYPAVNVFCLQKSQDNLVIVSWPKMDPMKQSLAGFCTSRFASCAVCNQRRQQAALQTQVGCTWLRAGPAAACWQPTLPVCPALLLPCLAQLPLCPKRRTEPEQITKQIRQSRRNIHSWERGRDNTAPEEKGTLLPLPASTCHCQSGKWLKAS